MAFAADDQNDATNKQSVDPANIGYNAAPAGNGGSGSSLFGGTPSGGTTAGADRQGQPQTANSSGSFTNLQSYLDANHDQGASMGQNVAGGVDASAKAAQGALGHDQDVFNQGVAANTVTSDKDLLGQVGKTPDAITGDQGKLDAWNKQYNASYANGPTDLTKSDDWSKTLGAYDTANTGLKNAGTEAGRETLLQDAYKRPDYSAGQQKLDQLLVSQSPESQKAFGDLRNNYAGLGNEVGNAQQAASAAGIAAQDTTNATNAAAHDALTRAHDALNTQVQQEFADATAKHGADVQAARDAVSSGDFTHLTPEQLQAFGLDPSMHTYGAGLGSYFTEGSNPTLANSASAADYTHAQALADLAAGKAGGGTSDVLNATGANQAGQAATTPAYTFNNAGFNSAVAAKQAEANKQVADLTDQANAWLRENYLKTGGDSYTAPGGTGGTSGQLTQNTGYTNVSADPNSANYIGNRIQTLDPALGKQWAGITDTLNRTLNGQKTTAAPLPGGTSAGIGARQMYKGGLVTPKIPNETANPWKPMHDFKRLESVMSPATHYADGGEVLDANARAHIADTNFALPGRRYPVEDAMHARNALARVAQNGTPSEKAEVSHKVHAKYPSIGRMLDGGGKVPGTAPVPGDSPKNDFVPATLSPGEVVLPRSVTQAEHAPSEAYKFMSSQLKKHRR